VAVYTKTHLKIHPFDSVHGFHNPMAFRASNLLLDMSLVVEDHVLSQIIGLSPRRGYPGVEIPMLLFDLGMVCNDIVMTIKALFHGWQTWMFGAPHIRMTELTLDLLHPRMETVAKGYGLFRPYVHCWLHVK